MGEEGGEVAVRGRGGRLLEMITRVFASSTPISDGVLLPARLFASRQVARRGDIVFDGIPRALINRGILLFFY